MFIRYSVRPSEPDDPHHAPDYGCVVHCDCNDHYYRSRDCKHIRFFLTAYGAEGITYHA